MEPYVIQTLSRKRGRHNKNAKINYWAKVYLWFIATVLLTAIRWKTIIISVKMIGFLTCWPLELPVQRSLFVQSQAGRTKCVPLRSLCSQLHSCFNVGGEFAHAVSTQRDTVLCLWTLTFWNGCKPRIHKFGSLPQFGMNWATVQFRKIIFPIKKPYHSLIVIFATIFF